MTAQIIDGKAIAQRLQAEMAAWVHAHREGVGRSPGLAVFLVGDDPASAAYVANKERACTKVGIAATGQRFPAEVSQAEVQGAIAAANADPAVDGILLQLPVPPHLDSIALLNAIAPDKDADGLHPENLGKLVRGEPGLRSCTPAGTMYLLQQTGRPIAGQKAVVIGRSILVGKPMALLLLAANATVTVAHSHTADLAAVVREADIVVAAMGRPRAIHQVKPGAIVLDVGINRVVENGQSRLVGDVDFAQVAPQAAWITPVPGGVGPMTVTMLLYNTLWSYAQRHGLAPFSLG
ncbi:MAG TPA: bifunctional methylenetetrahydrofolate dehydrogenase/methenyltetrahydrofolate cyclohydrolase FolD [Cyanobacteria bacterium UBA8156]|nr:bifunctional methylenetetrahydrofolate dehydrogenase/methenyltetrahydrofolate cyclohydrolase FolD [Cyanobacteria bacterium UBA8156]